MKAPRSISLLVVWRLAELEAKHLGATQLEPAHFLIGLAKAVDVDWIEVVDKEDEDREAVVEELLREMRKLREELEGAGLNPKRLRRRLRKAIGLGQPKKEVTRLRRSKEARLGFNGAEKLAELAGTPVYPRHLLRAVGAAADARLLGLLHAAGMDVTCLAKAGAAADGPGIGPSLAGEEPELN
jgi:hypothetical protein